MNEKTRNNCHELLLEQQFEKRTKCFGDYCGPLCFALTGIQGFCVSWGASRFSLSVVHCCSLTQLLWGCVLWNTAGCCRVSVFWAWYSMVFCFQRTKTLLQEVACHSSQIRVWVFVVSCLSDKDLNGAKQNMGTSLFLFILNHCCIPFLLQQGWLPCRISGSYSEGETTRTGYNPARHPLRRNCWALSRFG